MFTKVKSTAVAVKNHVGRNKFAYAASTVAVAAIAIQAGNRIAFYAFLEEKGIDPMEFYCPEMLLEMES